jgi:glutamate racemase
MTEESEMAQGLDDRTRAPIGVFDSGVGGLSVVQELRRVLPHEDIIYLADTAHCPYGPRPRDEIAALSEGCAGWLAAQGAKVIVVACNTASAAALSHLRSWAGPALPVVGLVPAVKPAVEHTRSRRIVVLATVGTLRGTLLNEVIARFATPAGVEVLTAVSPLLVPAIEAGAVDTAETRAILAATLDPAVAAGADAVVLGCTHYPFLRPLLHDLYGDRLAVLDSGAAIARRTAQVLGEHSLRAPGPAIGQLAVYTSGDATTVGPVVARLLGETLPVRHADLNGAPADSAGGRPGWPLVSAPEA